MGEIRDQPVERRAGAHRPGAVVPEAARVLLAQPDLQGQLRLLQSLDGNKVGVFAYCFCEIK